MDHPPHPSPALPRDTQPVLTLPWLRLLRWVAVVGQTLAVMWAVWHLRIDLPLPQLAALIAFTALSNLALHQVPAGRGEQSWMLASVISLDAALLTGLLHYSGGAHNPFSLFYLVHVALAAVALAPVWVACIALVSTAGYALLFAVGPADCHASPVIPMELHLTGMLVAQGLTAACIVLFAGRLQRALRRREKELLQAREEMARQERFASLAMLAAGAAHELGTPLNTIAIAAGEVARVAREEAVPPELAEDAQLILEELSRCRGILDRLQQENIDRPVAVRVEDLLAEVGRRLGAESARMQVQAAPALPPLHVPWEASVQALLSLTRNALDASPAQSPVRVTATALDRSVRLEVIDQGTGLDEAARVHAGEPFYTTKAPGRGMGLGLFLVRLFSARAGGSFVLENLSAGGACARLDLPIGVP